MDHMMLLCKNFYEWLNGSSSTDKLNMIKDGDLSFRATIGSRTAIFDNQGNLIGTESISEIMDR
jgi:hypothetical protein